MFGSYLDVVWTDGGGGGGSGRASVDAAEARATFVERRGSALRAIDAADDSERGTEPHAGLGPGPGPGRGPGRRRRHCGSRRGELREH
jgi:hypothetical protein